MAHGLVILTETGRVDTVMAYVPEEGGPRIASKLETSFFTVEAVFRTQVEVECVAEECQPRRNQRIRYCRTLMTAPVFSNLKIASLSNSDN